MIDPPLTYEHWIYVLEIALLSRRLYRQAWP